MKTLIKILCAALVLSSAAVFSGCGDESTDPTQSAVTTAETTVSAAETTASVSDQADMSKLHAIDYEGDDFAGAWRITDGEGSNFKSFVYVFDGKKKAYLVIGTTGYIENYSLEKKAADDGSVIDTFTAELMFGVNGTYTYEFSDDKNTLTLTSVSGGSTTTLEKLPSFSYIPEPDPDPVIDEALLGTWKDDNDEYYYFDKSGIMYNSINDLNFTFAKYSAKDGKVTSTYTTNKEEKNTVAYSISGEYLKYGDFTFKRASSDELK